MKLSITALTLSILSFFFIACAQQPAPPTMVGIVVGTQPIAPANATVVANIQALPTWQAQHDPGTGTGAASTGAMSLVASPSLSGQAREFDTTYTNYGGELYSDVWGSDTTAHNFLYDGWVYMADSTNVAVIEMDMNQVLANGDTMIFGFQCDGWNGTWDYTENAGTPAKPVDKWVPVAGAPCNPKSWAANAWHHVQILYARDDSGNAIYEAVWLDGVEEGIHASVPSEFTLGWDSVLLTNFQIDGGPAADGSSTVLLDKLVISRW